MYCIFPKIFEIFNRKSIKYYNHLFKKFSVYNYYVWWWSKLFLIQLRNMKIGLFCHILVKSFMTWWPILWIVFSKIDIIYKYDQCRDVRNHSQVLECIISCSKLKNKMSMRVRKTGHFLQKVSRFANTLRISIVLIFVQFSLHFNLE